MSLARFNERIIVTHPKEFLKSSLKDSSSYQKDLNRDHDTNLLGQSPTSRVYLGVKSDLNHSFLFSRLT